MVPIRQFATFCLLAVQNVKAASFDFELYTQESIAFTACQAVLTASANFCVVAQASSGHGRAPANYTCLCEDDAAFGTLTQCYMELGNVTSWIEYFLRSCNTETKQTLSLHDFYEAYENSSANLVDPTGEDFNASVVTKSPVKLDEETVVLYFRSYRGRYLNYNAANYFGIIMLSYWGLVMVIAGICNWTVYFFPAISNLMIFKQIRQYLILPAVHRTHASDARFLKVFHYLIPNRLDSTLIGIWLIMCVAFEVSRYDMVFPNAIFKSRMAMTGRLIADRSGVTSLYCFPLLILFAGRNNFLQFVTRWKFSRMIAIHRYVARVTVLIVLVHTCSMSASGWALGSFSRRNGEPYVQWGWVAIVCGMIILVQGSLYLRRKSYEAFYILHILMALFFTIGGYKHTDHEELGAWYYAAVAIWAFDRFLRVVRLLLFGFPRARVELRAEETLKVTIPKPLHWKPHPGQHAFVHFLRPSCFWQSHPFTLVESLTEESSIHFFVKVKGGVTHGLFKYLSAQPNKIGHIRVTVEGPYGSSAPLHRFDDLLFIAGGNGIPGMFAEAMHAMKQGNSKQRIKLYWVVRQWKSLSWFADELKLFEKLPITPVIYITRPEMMEGADCLNSCSCSSDSDSTSDWEKKNEAEVTEKSRSNEKFEDPIEKLRKFLPHVKFEEGRPPIEGIVKESISEAQGPLAVVACAHPNMVDDTRAAVVKNMSSTKNLVEFYDQLQVW